MNGSSSDTTTNDSARSALHSSLEILVPLLSFYWTPVVSIAGLLANTVVVVVLTRPFVDSSGWVMYTVGIVVTETVHLATRLDRWLSTLGFDLYGRIGGWCQLVTFLSDAAECLALWYAVCLGVDRVVRRLPPRTLTKFVTSATFVRTALVLLSVVAIVVYVNTSITFGEVRYEGMTGSVCMALAMFETVLFRLETVGAFVNSALPLCLLLTSELFIGIALFARTPRHHFRLAQSSAEQAIDATSATEAADDAGGQTETDMERSLASIDTDRSVFVFIGCLLFTNLPIHVFNDVHTVWWLAAGRNLGFGLWQYLLQSALEELKSTNEAVGLVLLAATSQVFRDAFSRTVAELFHRQLSCQRHDDVEFSV